jgi:hypothetical protein
MMGQQVGLGLGGFGKACLQHLHNPLVKLLPRALEQGLIGGILDESMLKNINGPTKS